MKYRYALLVSGLLGIGLALHANAQVTPLPAMVEAKGTAQRVRELAQQAEQENDIPAARRKLEEASRLAEAHGDKELLVRVATAWMTRAVVGPTSFSTWQPEEALSWLQRAVTLGERGCPDTRRMASFQFHLGVIARTCGRLELAREQHLACLRLAEKVEPDRLRLSHVLQALAHTLQAQGDYEAARDCLRRSLAHRREAGNLDFVMTSLQSLAIVAGLQGDSAEQERLLMELERVASDHGMAVHASTALSLSAMYRARRDFPRADRHAVYAQGILEREWPDSIWMPPLYTELAQIRAGEGNHSAAERSLRQALAHAERLTPEGPQVASVCLAFARYWLWREDPAQAEPWARRAWQITGRQAAPPGDEARQGIAEQFQEYALALARAQLGQRRDREALLTVEAGRAGATLHLLAERRLLHASLPPALRSKYLGAARQEQDAQAAVSERGTALSRAEHATEGASRGTDPAARMTAEREMATARARFEEARSTAVAARLRREEAWTEVLRALPGATIPPLSEASLEAALRRLPEGSVLLTYVIGAGTALLFVAEAPAAGSRQPPRVTGFRLAASPARIKEQVAELNRLIAGARGEAVAAARETYGLLFPPAAREAVARARRLIVSPDGPLWELSFASLVTSPTGAEPRFLGLEKPLTLTRSLMLLDQGRRARRALASGKKPVVLAVGDPVFDAGPAAPVSVDAGPAAPVSVAAGGVPDPTPALTRVLRGGSERSFLLAGDTPPAPLPGTRGEAQEVARMYATTPLLGRSATEAAVRSRMAGADVIHLATHGYLHPHAPMASGLLLSPPPVRGEPPRAADDGALQAWEIASQLHLRAELVVLAACETGRGKNVRNEGLVGLARALQYAGARSVVASQWRVREDSTRSLMVHFHTELRRGEAKDDALRRAVRRVAGSPAWAHPYFWAGFVLVGDPDNPVLGVARPRQERTSPRSR